MSPLEPDHRKGPEWTQLITGQVDIFKDCEGYYVQRTCNLFPAILEYDIGIESGTVSILSGGNNSTAIMAKYATHANDCFLEATAFSIRYRKF